MKSVSASRSPRKRDTQPATTKSSDPAKHPVWSWTDAVAAADVPPLTKFVCLNIARYLSSAGKGWRISIRQMMEDTGLGNQALANHLAKAKKAGLLAIKREHDSRGHRSGTTYIPRFPNNVELDREPADMCEGTPSVRGTSRAPASPGVRGTSRKGSPSVSRTRVGDTRQVPSQTDISSHSPPTPSGGHARTKRTNELDQLRTEGQHPHVVENLIAPLYGVLGFGKLDPVALLRAIRDELASFPPEVLTQAAKKLRAERNNWPSAAQARAVCRELAAANGGSAPSCSPRAAGDPKLEDLLERLAECIGRPQVDIWFRSVTRPSYEAGRLVLQVENLFIADWIRRNYQEQVFACASAVFEGVERVEIRSVGGGERPAQRLLMEASP